MVRSLRNPWRLLQRLAPAMFVVIVGCDGCNDDAIDSAQVDAGSLPGGLTADQAMQVIAKVGDREITVGDFALTLERMNAQERLRFVTKERRRLLLDMMIDAELMAQEATRRGLDRRPEVAAAIRQRLREAETAKIHREAPKLASIAVEDIRQYYDDHLDDYREPERREATVIELRDPEKAKEVLELARAEGAQWGDLVFEHSFDPSVPKQRDPDKPGEFMGALGLVGPPGVSKGDNSRVPEPVREALFTLKKQGDVYPKVVQVGDKQYVVRMGAKTEGRTTSFENARRGIQILISQKLSRQREEQAVAELRKRFPVTIDDAVLESVKLPAGLSKYKPLWDEQ